MAKVFLIGLEQTIAAHIASVVSIERHTVHEKPHDVPVSELKDSGIVFAGGDPELYLPLLRRARKSLPSLPVVVVTRSKEMPAWLRAIDAGAADYCCLPISRRQIQWLTESLTTMIPPGSIPRLFRGPSTRRWVEIRAVKTA